jgi:hypothetical protein
VANRPDILTTNYGASAVSVLLGNGDGSFQSQQTFSVGMGPDSVAVADVNGDGRPDLITANYGSHSVSVLLGNGGTFLPDPFSSPGLPPGTFAVGSSPESVSLADVNGDGRLDLITANSRDNTVSVLLQWEIGHVLIRVYRLASPEHLSMINDLIEVPMARWEAEEAGKVTEEHRTAHVEALETAFLRQHQERVAEIARRWGLVEPGVAT